MSKFSVGDRVRHVEFGEGTVIFNDRDTSCLVEFDKEDKANLHTGGDRGKKDHCYWVWDNETTMVAIPKETNYSFNVGDRVLTEKHGLGTVVEVKSRVLVEFDKENVPSLHKGNGKSTRFACWYFDKTTIKEVKLIETAKAVEEAKKLAKAKKVEDRAFKTGDRVSHMVYGLGSVIDETSYGVLVRFDNTNDMLHYAFDNAKSDKTERHYYYTSRDLELTLVTETKVEAEEKKFKIGTRVNHPIYGDGVVVEITRSTLIRFDKENARLHGGNNAEVKTDGTCRYWWFAYPEQEMKVIEKTYYCRSSSGKHTICTHQEESYSCSFRFLKEEEAPKKIEVKVEPKVEPKVTGGIKVGTTVLFTNYKKHDYEKGWYPKVGTEGTVVGLTDFGSERLRVQWAKGSTSKDDKWYCSESDVELKVTLPKTGDFVIFMNQKKARSMGYYPAVGTIGKILSTESVTSSKDGYSIRVQWAKSSTSNDDKWSCNSNDVMVKSYGDSEPSKTVSKKSTSDGRVRISKKEYERAIQLLDNAIKLIKDPVVISNLDEVGRILGR